MKLSPLKCDDSPRRMAFVESAETLRSPLLRIISELSCAYLMPHTCPSCAALVFSITERKGTNGSYVSGEYGRYFIFNFWLEEALQAAKRGCTFFQFLTHDTTRGCMSGNRLVAAFSDYGPDHNVVFQWVNKADEASLSGYIMTICATEGRYLYRTY